MRRAVPGLILVSCLLYLSALYVATMRQRSDQSAERFDLDEFGRLPVVMNGRVQPIDSVARDALLRIRGTSEVPADQGGGPRLPRSPQGLGPTEWLLEVLARPHLADERRIFPVEPELRRELDPKADASSGPFYYSFKELGPTLEEVGQRGQLISEIQEQDRSVLERGLLALLGRLILYQRLKNSLQPNTFLQLQSGGRPVDYDLPALLARYQVNMPAGAAALKARKDGKAFNEAALRALMDFLQPYDTVSRVALLHFIPPSDPGRSPNGWQNIGASLRDSLATGRVPAPLLHMAAVTAAFAQNRPAEFNRSVSAYREWLVTNGLEKQPTLSGRKSSTTATKG